MPERDAGRGIEPRAAGIRTAVREARGHAREQRLTTRAEAAGDDESRYSAHSMRSKASSLHPQLDVRFELMRRKPRADRYFSSSSKVANSNGNPPTQSIASYFALMP